MKLADGPGKRPIMETLTVHSHQLHFPRREIKIFDHLQEVIFCGSLMEKGRKILHFQVTVSLEFDTNILGGQQVCVPKLRWFLGLSWVQTVLLRWKFHKISI